MKNLLSMHLHKINCQEMYSVRLSQRFSTQKFCTLFAKQNNMTNRHKKMRQWLEMATCNLEQFASSEVKPLSGIMSQSDNSKKMFRVSDYDCVGFDLDNTILRYRVSNMVKLEYNLLAKFLVEEKGYSADYLLKPITSDIGFLQKGLVLDFLHGNILKMSIEGYVLQASHGTQKMTDEEIEECYGVDRRWDVGKKFTENMLEAWNGPISEQIRCLLDCFDMPSSLAFARIVDSLDAKKGSKNDEYNIWPDVLSGLYDMFLRENFDLNKGGYFAALKANPDMYLTKCDQDVINWLKKIKETKIVFLVTGSNVDFASFTATYALGDDWRSLFDVVVCFARKPGFFTGSRPFLELDGIRESGIVLGKDLKLNGSIYSQGNWKELYTLFGNHKELEQPKCLYIGDNLIQDVYTPSEFITCDTVSVVEEVASEELEIPEFWGSYFCTKKDNRTTITGSSIWNFIIQKYSKICIPNLNVLAILPLDHGIRCFESQSSINEKSLSGFYPKAPVTISLSKDC